jgi:transposase
VVDILLAAGLAVFVISSRQVRALRPRYGSAGNKDDRFDAFVLADVLRTDANRLAPLVPDTAATQALRGLVRARKELIKHRIALHNQLLAHLLAAFPGAVGLFAELDSPISLRLLSRFPGPGRAGWLSERRLAAWLGSVGYCGRKTPAELMSHLDRAPAGITGPAEHAMTVITDQFVTTLRDLRVRIEVLDAEIAEALHLHPDGKTFTSLPRAGTNRAALLLAEIGDCRSASPTTPPWPPQPGSPPQPGPAANDTTSPSGTAATRNCARQSSTSPPTAAEPAPGPQTSTTAPEPEANDTHTPCASSPEPGYARSGAAGTTTPPTTRPPHRPQTTPRRSRGLTQGSQAATTAAYGGQWSTSVTDDQVVVQTPDSGHRPAGQLDFPPQALRRHRPGQRDQAVRAGRSCDAMVSQTSVAGERGGDRDFDVQRLPIRIAPRGGIPHHVLVPAGRHHTDALTDNAGPIISDRSGLDIMA